MFLSTEAFQFSVIDYEGGNLHTRASSDLAKNVIRSGFTSLAHSPFAFSLSCIVVCACVKAGGVAAVFTSMHSSEPAVLPCVGLLLCHARTTPHTVVEQFTCADTIETIVHADDAVATTQAG